MTVDESDHCEWEIDCQLETLNVSHHTVDIAQSTNSYLDNVIEQHGTDTVWDEETEVYASQDSPSAIDRMVYEN